MNDETLEKTATELAWQQLLERVAAFCFTEVAQRSLSALMPAPTLELAQARTARTREAMALLEVAPLPAARFEDPSERLALARGGASLDARELRALANMLEQSTRLMRHLERHADVAPLLASYLATSPELAPLEAAISRSIGPDGAILDAAAPALARARQRAHTERHELRQRLASLMTRLGPALQDQFVAEREGRFVLPVRADAPFRVAGLLFGSSASGNTLYVEPEETHELNNRVQLAEASVRAEETRVLRELNALVAEQLEAVTRAQTVCVEADVLRALALYARSVGALALELEAEPGLDLRGLRHPLLLAPGRTVVANDLRLQAGRGLVLSGPNAGGKTVALAGAGLAAWMARAGIPVPVAPGSRIGWFEHVLTDIGDHQSLGRSLSTFSAHMQQVALALELAGPATLVLIDELAGGTDPDEGAALAIAIVEALVERGAALIVTTHHEPLKAFAAAHPRLDNAAVGFDRERLAPTFSLEHGVPGASGALLVATRFGIDAAIIARAEAVMPEAAQNQRALLTRLDEHRERLAAAAAEVEAERQLAAELRRELEQERSRRTREERGRLSQETQTVLDEVQRARQRLRDAEGRLGPYAAEAGALSEARRATNDLARFVSIGGKLHETVAALDPVPKPERAPLSWDELALGTRVSLPGMGTSGSVVAKPKRDRVTVAVGAMKTTVGIEALSLSPQAPEPNVEKASGARGGARRQRTTASAASESIAPEGGEPMRMPSNTLNLVGERVEPALDRFDAFIDTLLRSGEPVGFVVHGHGTGVLRGAVRERARQHPNVKRSGPASREDGGDALTLVWIG